VSLSSTKWHYPATRSSSWGAEAVVIERNVARRLAQASAPARHTTGRRLRASGIRPGFCDVQMNCSSEAIGRERRPRAWAPTSGFWTARSTRHRPWPPASGMTGRRSVKGVDSGCSGVSPVGIDHAWLLGIFIVNSFAVSNADVTGKHGPAIDLEYSQGSVHDPRCNRAGDVC